MLIQIAGLLRMINYKSSFIHAEFIIKAYAIFRYSCIFPRKLVISKSDLAARIESNVASSFPVKCQANGAYNYDIMAYTCTKSCPIPALPNFMYHNSTITTANAEYRDAIK